MSRKKHETIKKYKIKMDGHIFVIPYIFRLQDLNSFENQDIYFVECDSKMVKSFMIYNDRGENFVFAFDTAIQCCEDFEYRGLEDILGFSSENGCYIIFSQDYENSIVTLKIQSKKKKSAQLTLILRDLAGYYAHDIFIGYDNQFYYTKIR